jgi:hypothetical protein
MPETKAALIAGVLERCTPDPRGERIVRSSLSCLDASELTTLIEFLDAAFEGTVDEKLRIRGQEVINKTAAFIAQHNPARKSSN